MQKIYFFELLFSNVGIIYGSHRLRDRFWQGFDRFLHGELIKPKIFGDVVTVKFIPLLDPPGRGNMAEKNDVQVSRFLRETLFQGLRPFFYETSTW